MADKNSEEVKRKRSIASVQAYKDVFSTDKGKKVLWDLMKVSGMLSNGFVPGDPYSTAYNEGGRQVILHILSKVNVNIEKLETMIKQGENQAYDIFNEQGENL